MTISNTKIIIKKSVNSGNVPSSLANGEIAINSADGKLYYSTPSNVISFITNQLTFGTVNVGGSLILANTTSDTLSLIAGNNVTLLANTTTKRVTFNADTYLFKNRIINGGFQIAQELGSTSVTPTATQYTVDQWSAGLSQASKLTFQQVTDAPAGAKNSLKVTVASQYSPISTDVFCVTQPIEGNNITDFQWGTSGALTITTSFQVKSSITGTFSVSIANGAANRSYVATYTISSANVWTPLAVTIPGDQTGTWATDNTIGLNLVFDLGYGSNFNATAGSWQAGSYRNTSGSIKFVNQSAGATWQLAQVQLEPGTLQTIWDIRDYVHELLMCKRYTRWVPFSMNFAAYTAGSGNAILVPFDVEMRVTPSFSSLTSDPAASQAVGNSSGNSFLPTYSSTTGALASVTAGAAGQAWVYGYRALATARM